MTNTTKLPPKVPHVLEAAETFTPVADLPDGYEHALEFSVSKGWVVKRNFPLGHPYLRDPKGYQKPQYGTPLAGPEQLILMDEGRAALAEHRLWSEADADEGEPAETTEPEPSETKKSMSWKEAAEKLERKRSQGEKFTSQPKLADQLGCAVSTINRAIHSSPLLKEWAKVDEKIGSPRATSLGEPVLDAVSQSRELDPSDAAAEREAVDEAERILNRLIQDGPPKTKAILNRADVRAELDRMPAENRIKMLQMLDDDPDQYAAILGRKP